MAKVEIKINDAGVKQFLHSPELEKYLLKLAKRVSNDDPRYTIEPYERPSRKVVNIVDRAPNARAHEAAHGKLAAMSIVYITDEL